MGVVLCCDLGARKIERERKRECGVRDEKWGWRHCDDGQEQIIAKVQWPQSRDGHSDDT
jgi:hypothetical protein